MNMAVAAQLTLIGRNNLAGTSIDEELEMPKMGSDFKSVVEGASAFLAIQNAGMEEAQATVTCFDRGIPAQVTLQIPANNVRFLHNCEPLTGNLASASHALPELAFRPDPVTPKQSGRVAAFEVNGGMSELTVFGLTASSAEKERIGGAIFVNQSDFTSRSTVFAGMPVGPYAPLPGAVFTPSLAMANLTNSVRTVTVRAAFEGSLEPPRVLGTMTLQPFETRRFEMPTDSADAAAMVNILADQDGRPGDVVFALSDKDSLTAASALKPLPKFLTHANNGGGHPWSLRPGTSSTLVLFNASAKKQLVNLNLGANGIAWSRTVTLEPNQTFSMPIQQIIDGANADQKSPEKKIKALQGEISWFTPDQADVFGRVLIARDDGASRALESYSCGSNIVLCGLSMSNSFAAINYLSTGFLGPLAPQFCASWAPTQCSGTQYGGGNVSSYSWNSINMSTTPISGSSNQMWGSTGKISEAAERTDSFTLEAVPKALEVPQW